MDSNSYLAFIRMRVLLAGAVSILDEGESRILGLIENDRRATDDFESIGHALLQANSAVCDLIEQESKRQ